VREKILIPFFNSKQLQNEKRKKREQNKLLAEQRTPEKENIGMNCFSRKSGAKRRYVTKDEALGHAGTLQQKYGNKMEVYKCRYCGFWHLATKIKK
jgi:hypothetical protein